MPLDSILTKAVLDGWAWMTFKRTLHVDFAVSVVIAIGTRLILSVSSWTSPSGPPNTSTSWFLLLSSGVVHAPRQLSGPATAQNKYSDFVSVEKAFRVPTRWFPGLGFGIGVFSREGGIPISRAKQNEVRNLDGKSWEVVYDLSSAFRSAFVEHIGCCRISTSSQIINSESLNYNHKYLQSDCLLHSRTHRNGNAHSIPIFSLMRIKMISVNAHMAHPSYTPSPLLKGISSTFLGTAGPAVTVCANVTTRIAASWTIVGKFMMVRWVVRVIIAVLKVAYKGNNTDDFVRMD
jgi:hypothetical protein